jgi:hypothetical protein
MHKCNVVYEKESWKGLASILLVIYNAEQTKKYATDGAWNLMPVRMNECTMYVHEKRKFYPLILFLLTEDLSYPVPPSSDDVLSSFSLLRFLLFGFLCAALGLGGLNVGDTVVKLLLENGAIPNVILLLLRENGRGVEGPSVAVGVSSALVITGNGNELSNALSSSSCLALI